MAILPKKFEPGQGGTEKRLEALELYVKYMEERLEHYERINNKKFEEVKGNDSIKQEA